MKEVAVVVFTWIVGVAALGFWLAAEVTARRREAARRRWVRAQDREWIRRQQERERILDRRAGR